MSGWWLCGFIVVTLNMMVVTSKVDLNSQIRVAQCRATCLYKIKMDNLTDASCRLSHECLQCWGMCPLLQSNKENLRYCLLSDCGPACREACRFQTLHPHQEPSFSPLHEDNLQLTDAGVSWPPQVAVEPVVNLVLPSGLQTLDSHAGVPGGPSLRVLAVDWRGVVKVLSPPQESPLSRVRTIIRSLGLNFNPLYRRVGNSNSTIHTPTANNETATRPWRLRQQSLMAQSTLVLVTISWDPQQLSVGDQLTYLVTWEVEGGIIHGNLLTNATSATLSLWPETVYKVQVSSLDPESAGSQSEPLVVSTHHIPQESPVTRHESPVSHPLVIGRQAQAQLVAAAVAILLLATLVTTWRWQHRLSLPHSKLIDEQIGTPNLYRVFPPVIRLIGERQKSSPEVFTSTDNLLQPN